MQRLKPGGNPDNPQDWEAFDYVQFAADQAANASKRETLTDTLTNEPVQPLTVRRLSWQEFWHRRPTKIHLVALTMRGWDLADRALCGQVVNHEEAREDTGTGTHWVCKRCLIAYAKRQLAEPSTAPLDDPFLAAPR
jgi:hypothetical protein